MPNTRQVTSVILAAGKGTRMQIPYHKVCCPVAGTPVIVRSLETYHRCGITFHLLVVGQHAEQVMSTASVVPTHQLYCYQAEQKGTGHAAKIAATLLEAQGYDGDIMIVAGDKVLEDGVVHRLLDEFYRRECDLAFLVGAPGDFPGSGRIVTDGDGAILGNIEVFDVARMRLLIDLQAIVHERPIPADEAKRLAMTYFSKEEKAAKALGILWTLLLDGQPIGRQVLEEHFSSDDFTLMLHGARYSPALLDNVKYVNLSTYLFKAPALYRALRALGSNNAQNEEYLTDTIGILAAEGARLSMVPLHYSEEAMAFNTPEELLAIEDYYHNKLQPVG